MSITAEAATVPYRPGSRPTWPFAVPVAVGAVAVGLPALVPSFPDRPAQLLVGALFPDGQELLLALILLASARGLLLRRRVAHHVILTLIAVKRTHNAGVTTEVLSEGDLGEPDRERLRALATRPWAASRSAASR